MSPFHSTLPRSDTHSLKFSTMKCRLFCVRGQMKSEAILVEIPIHAQPIGSFLRSRGCYVLYHVPSRKVYLWKGSRVTLVLYKAALRATKSLRKR